MLDYDLLLVDGTNMNDINMNIHVERVGIRVVEMLIWYPLWRNERLDWV